MADIVIEAECAFNADIVSDGTLDINEDVTFTKITSDGNATIAASKTFDTVGEDGFFKILSASTFTRTGDTNLLFLEIEGSYDVWNIIGAMNGIGVFRGVLSDTPQQGLLN